MGSAPKNKHQVCPRVELGPEPCFRAKSNKVMGRRGPRTLPLICSDVPGLPGWVELGSKPCFGQLQQGS